jgi:hypothetical protein
MSGEQDDRLIPLLIQMEQRAIGAAPSRELIDYVARHHDRINNTEVVSSLPAQTLLHRAAFVGNKLVAAWLLIKAANINTVDGDGKTPLDYAIAKQDQDLIDYLRSKGGLSGIDRYIDNWDGTVTDIRTGLTWMRCALGQTWDGNDCIGKANVYMWSGAIDLKLKHGGYDDWRLPSIDELKSIIDTTRTRPSIDTSTFPGTPSWYFWSSTPDAFSLNPQVAPRITS